MTSHADHLNNLLIASYRSKGQGDDRSGDTNIHVSNLINFCPRSYFLCRKHDRSFHGHKHPGMQMGWTFDIGHALQKIQVQRLMTQQVIFGSWECRHCKHLEVGLQATRRPCPKCQCRAWKYKDLGVEVQLPVATKPKSQITISGHIDYVVATSATSGFIVDAKSIKAEDFDALKEPHIDYKRQVRLYMWLLNEKRRKIVGVPRDALALESFRFDPNHAVICYCVKGARKEPFRSYVVEQDKAFISKIKNQLQLLAECIEKNEAPAAICKSQANSMAKECTARTVCFAGKGR
jgi:hypothetical protein